MKRFARFVGKLPFCGKFAIKQFAFNYYQCVTTEERKKKYIGLMAFLVFFILGHAYQAGMGIHALISSLPIWAKVISLLYVLANCLAMYAQAYLSYRVTHTILSGAPLCRKKRSYKEPSDSETLSAIIFTYGGSMAFLSFCFSNC